MRAVGRLIRHCGHRSGWERAAGEERCRDCGARRFTDYAALLMPERPVAAATPPPRDPTRADRAAAALIAHGLHRLSRWGTSAATWRLAV
ncbi:hypothetical protein J7W19_18900 [Streptomyces mobaraensis NBRC 13819 = DSM 40847]|uniref:Uncharacterized protein n=1 Tax=Streptomyces mobaraensis (strain ATCC 29032 / DSM 40847 / JCM 4168 / NBRC 13819 / NCIMB 11159 / IPCR 16-22) TaxID=1223523 RepID=M2ZVL0_STRM1|nr:DUF6255 family natural product biosynthesis protein [Streptomyces mobaraensis]EME96758.1 hypothetical protein H340_29881 [Streptomyces mobaraensis NBRC 13819 = DSM 40847]QTT75164.1 hypothetical protein J7W19_18900 [Streptomyces mobaraensis NBRC 13819 = DSM 40847]